MSDNKQLSVPVYLKQDGQFYNASFKWESGALQQPVQARLPTDARRSVALYRNAEVCVAALERKKPRFPKLSVHVWTWIDPEWGPVASLGPLQGICLRRSLCALPPELAFLTSMRDQAATRMKDLGITDDWRATHKVARITQEAKPGRVSIRTVSGGLPTLGRRRR
ncbi:hypothetical protein IGX29_15305 [Streptomyces sp. H28]|uniref:hypothetical protein n=1 Tax=Streptomyces sp. H28 TaxID=2775865 RepID=UPI00177C56F5|nr:hypothetical protein [Streptomyces sp. H28]MBD9733147.1 hypothetical protein [Streptomyces sp. H28]